jgi:hypothetical protein
MILPNCNICIPGLVEGNNNGNNNGNSNSNSNGRCNIYNVASMAIRKELANLVELRYGKVNVPSNRTFALYRYLETPEFMIRHETFGTMLVHNKAKNIVDIGAYYTPIYLWLPKDNSNYCPTSVVIVEPILDALSAMIPCANNPGSYTHLIILPVTFKYYTEIKKDLPTDAPDSIICIGCDSHFGPTRRLLETVYTRPYTLYIEYPPDYFRNAPFKKMVGQGNGEKMIYMKDFTATTNETEYTRRSMKVIVYSNEN